MALAPGTRLGPYEIGPLLGQGGMGEVYRARDRNLRRDVALKILPTAVAADADRLARFRREAHVLASLNHPHIAQIYGLEDGDTPALVLELVDGPTLSDRIAAGPLSVLEALRVARQIAEALEAAHALDIIHRDLKPANVKVRPDGTVKVLDFGLARGADPSVGADSGVTTAYAATALGAGLTTPGAILGTAAYMSPEQAAGQAADKRSDIWSFGVVLFEMLTGRRSFNGDSFAHVLAAVMRSEPDWTALPADTPPSIRTLIRRALDKDRKRRLADIHDAWLEIDDALSAPASAAPNAPPMIVRRGSVTWWLAAALTVALSIVVVLWAPWRATAPVDRPPMRLNVDLGPEAVAGQSFDVAISPDATRLAFPARSPDGKTLLATRLLSEPTQTMLPGTEGARAPFFSPDGQWIGFAAGGQIRKVAVQGGAVVSICDAVSVLGATWAEGQAIVFGRSPFFPLLRVSSNGGKPEPVTKTGELGDATHRWPQALPGGHAILFTSHKIVTGFDDASVEAVTMSSGARKMLVRGGYAARFASTPDGNGYLLYVRNGTLFAAPFDLESLAVRGAAVPVLENVAGDSDSGAGAFDVSRNGTIVYKSGQGPARRWPVVWLDSTGKTEPMIGTPGTYYTPRMSPDGTPRGSDDRSRRQGPRNRGV